MNNLFKVDSPIYKFATYVYYTLALSFLWFIGCVPLITIGASNTALFYVSSKIIRGEDFELFKDFFKSYKENFFRATLIFIILSIITIIFIININLYITNPSLPRWTMIIQFILVLELCIVAIYSFPMLARYHMTVSGILKTSLFMGNKHIGTSLQGLIFIATAIALIGIFPSLFIFISPGLIGLSNYYVLDKVFAKYSEESNLES